jgi:DNA-binding NarL/FixJ family response regulator
MKQVIRIILADDHEIFRDGFAGMFRKPNGIELIAEARNGRQLLVLVGKLKPDIVLTDIRMPEMDGIVATKQIGERYPDVGVIAFSMYDDEHLILDMMTAGAKGYLVKNAQKSEVLEAIRTVFKGKPFFCNHSARTISRIISRKKTEEAMTKPLLSEREREIVKLICEEKLNTEIAGILHLSVRTIEGYRERIMEKTEAKNIAGLVIYAIRNRLYEIK